MVGVAARPRARARRTGGISINQLIATSLAETMPALVTREYLEARAKRGSRQAFQGVLRKVKDRPVIVGAER